MTDDPITAYGQAWLAVDADERSTLLEVAWAPDAVYSDPLDHLQHAMSSMLTAMGPRA